MSSNYRVKDVPSAQYAKNCSVRFESTMSKIGNKIKHPCLDVGEVNILGRALEADYWIDNELNEPWINYRGGDYQIGEYRVEFTYPFETILCLEVLEHLEKPDILLREIKNHLALKGKLYITTPCKWWMGKGKKHFAEYDEKELRGMLLSAGFGDLKISRIRAYNLSLKHFGLRSLIRWLRDILIGQCFFN